MKRKHAEVFRMGRQFFAVVSVGGVKVGEFSASTQSAVIDWLEEEHYDIDSLRIKTA